MDLDWEHQLTDVYVIGSMTLVCMKGQMGASFISDVGPTIVRQAEGPVLASCAATARPLRAETGWRVLGMGRGTGVANVLGLWILVLSLAARVAGMGVGGASSPRRRAAATHYKLSIAWLRARTARMRFIAALHAVEDATFAMGAQKWTGHSPPRAMAGG